MQTPLLIGLPDPVQVSAEGVRAILEALPEAAALWDSADRLLICNQRYRELLGPVADVLTPGVSFTQVMRATAGSGLLAVPADRLEDWLNGRLAQHALGEGSQDVRTAAGRWQRIREVRTETGGTLTLVTDVTTIKRRESALKDSQERFVVAMRGANEGIWDWNLMTGEVYISPRVGDILHIASFRDTTAPREWTGRILVEDLPRYRDAVQLHLKGATEVYSCEYRVAGDDGVDRWIADRGLALRDATGRAYRMAGSIRDITDRKRTESELRRTRDEAEAASRAKSEFLANMSHELRTPLNAIIGFSDVMRSEMLGPLGSPEYRTYAEDINKSGRHLLDVICDVLDVAKAEAGRLELNEGIVDLTACVRDSLRMVDEEGRARQLTFTNRVGASAPKLLGDARKIKQMLLNLLSNAVKFTPKGGEVTISWSRAANGLALSVEDTGIGMDRDVLTRATHPFEQADSRLDRKYQGAGLGLSIVRAMIELHQGSLHLHSEPGSGTTATLWFPTARLNPPPEAPDGFAQD